jgi:hypothetical protein
MNHKEKTGLGAFISTSGRRAQFEAIHVEISLIGVLEGDLLFIRDHLLERMTKTVSRKFGNTGLLLREPPPGPLPTYAFFAQFCSDPINKEFDGSSLTIVWFSDSIPPDIGRELLLQFQGVDWERYATDGIV